MAGGDLLIIILFFLSLIIIAIGFVRRHRFTSDYYLAGRKLPSWALGVSLAANQASAISLIGAPAFVAMREGGGLTWLQYELAVPLAMAVLVAWGVPLLYQARGASVYAILQNRLGVEGRRSGAWLFLVGRGGSTGVILYASALVVEAVTGLGIEASLILVGFVALAYTALGGLAADVVTDVFQFGLLWGGTLVAGLFLALRLSAQGTSFLNIDPSRLRTLDFAGHGWGDNAVFSFWPMLLGGLFLYLSYYGCDQTQVQRLLSCRSLSEARRALMIASFLRFPLVLTYCGLGLLLAALVKVDTVFAGRLIGKPSDSLVPEFIAYWLPAGWRGIAIVGILAAALSSIDSAFNSLSAVTLEEVLPRRWSKSLLAARLVTVGWGVATVMAAFAFSRATATTVEIVNRLGSAVYGPTLALFFAALWLKPGRGFIISGVMAGLISSLIIAWLVPGVSWMWWNLIGFSSAAFFFLIGTRNLFPKPKIEAIKTPEIIWLMALFISILVILALIPSLFG